MLVWVRGFCLSAFPEAVTNFLSVGTLNNLFSQIIRPHTPCFLSLVGTMGKSEGMKVKIVISAKSKTGDGPAFY